MDLPYAELIGIIFCLFFSAFFSGTETALTSLSEVKVQQLIDAHSQWGKALTHWQKNYPGVLTTILIGNNLSNITASALAADLATTYFAANGIPIAIGVMTFLLLISGEITPKTIALTYSDSLALPLINILMIFHFTIYPVTWLITHIIRMFLRLVGGRDGKAAITEKDIEYIVTLGRREGAIDQEKENLLISIFEFSDTTAKEIMVPRTDMLATESDTTYEKLLEITLESGYSRIPVYGESIDHVLGIFNTKSLLTPPKASEKSSYLKDRLGPVVFVPESKKISEVLKLFQKNHIHISIVVDEFGGTAGLVTMEDIIEELLGEIQDEFDTEEMRLQKTKNGGYLADARIEIDELEDTLKIEFPEHREYESLGGFLMEMAGDVPAVGWQHEYKGYSFHVKEADLNKVIKVDIERLISTGEEAPSDPETQVEESGT